MATTTRPVDVVMTTEGGSSTADAVLRAGALLGMASNHNPPGGRQIDFLDWPFATDNPSWRQHLQLARRFEPRYAVAPDVEADRDLGWVIEKADVLDDYADRVIVPVKDAHPRQVPNRHRVGLPFQPGFGSGGVSVGQVGLGAFTTDTNTIRDFEEPGVGDVHVLGGAPHDQLRLQEFDLRIRSIDTSMAVVYARFGDVWFEDGRVEMGDIGFYDRIEASVRNILRAWGHDVAQTLTLEQAIERKLDALDILDEREVRRRQRGRGPPLIDPEGPSGPIRDPPGHIPEAIDEFVRHEYADILE